VQGPCPDAAVVAEWGEADVAVAVAQQRQQRRLSHFAELLIVQLLVLLAALFAAVQQLPKLQVGHRQLGGLRRLQLLLPRPVHCHLLHSFSNEMELAIIFTLFCVGGLLHYELVQLNIHWSISSTQRVRMHNYFLIRYYNT
jgi:hypothetical protein